ncbi:centromere protein Q-like [Argopecten irradians]|uniref:centromere protein Q-like n=1 Tax=Argopecten irradians TaxID=31199 RepID=UPI0037233C40
MPPKKKKAKSTYVGSYATDDVITKRYSDTDINKWQKMEKPTEAFITEVLNNGISTILANCKRDKYSETEDHLMKSKRRLLKEWKEMKMPKNTFGDYREARKSAMRYTSILSELAEQESDLNIAVQETKRSCKAMEKEVEKRQRCLEEDNDAPLHPLLNGPALTSLKIPLIPRM